MSARAPGYLMRVIRRLTVVLAAVAALVLAVPALAATDSYRGKTSQGKKASARVVDGRVKLIKTAWSLPCRNQRDFRVTGGTRWTDTAEGPIEQPGDGTFTDSGVSTDTAEEGKARIKETISGTFDAKHMTARNTITVKIYNSAGKQIDTCKGTIRFDIPKV